MGMVALQGRVFSSSWLLQVLAEVSGPAVVGPMTTKHGLGKSQWRAKWQNLEKVFPKVCGGGGGAACADVCGDALGFFHGMTLHFSVIVTCCCCCCCCC